MASASVLLSEEQFLCSICLDVFTDPVSTPCGHNYCKACITHYWDTSDVCQCPLCQTVFRKRPGVLVNTFISEMADRFRESKRLNETSSTKREPAESDEPGERDEVACDVCTETKLKALKSCLVCQISYCETHLEPHQRIAALKRHKLINPVRNLEGVICKKHDRPLELFCKTDNACVCQTCTADHKSHQIVSLEEACEGRKAELGKTEAEVQQMIQERQAKIQEVTRTVELGKRDADREISDSAQVFTALISCIERSQAELIGVIEEKQKATEREADGFIMNLQQEITALKKRSSELKQLSDTEDHLHLLQNFPSINTPPPTKDWTKVNVHQYSHVGTVRTALKTLGQEMEKNLRDNELRKVQQYAVDVTLDPDTAHHKLNLSEDGKRVNHGNTRKNLQYNKERFSECTRVLGKQGFSSRRFYYEVQVKGKSDWSVGVARESIDRKRPFSQTPNNGYWSLWLSGNEYKALTYPCVRLPVKQKVQTVGVFVDYEEGLVSFYDVEARVHLYSFTGCTFTDKLYPILNPCDNDGGKNSSPLILSPVSHTD